ncbi:MAG: porin, partial [Gemmatimonadota bacterium]
MMRAIRWTLPLLAAPFVSLNAQDSSHTTIGGYGEVSYANLSGPNSPGRANLDRFVIYLAHTFNGKFALRSELEVEDARVEVGNPGGEVAVEQVYLDYRASGDLTLRTGLILAPVGILNEMHEPTTYNGVA